MNIKNEAKRLLHLFQALAVGMTLVWFAGCASTGYKKSDAAARSLDAAGAEVQAQRHALDTTIESLQDLINKPPADLKPQFARFSDTLDRLDASAKRNRDAAKRVSEKSADYFLAWDKEITSLNYEVIRSRSEARKEEVANLLKVVNRHYHEAQAALQPLLDYLHDIRKTLSADLTTGGLESVKNFVSNAQENATKVDSALSKLSMVLADASASMSSAPVQTTAVAGTKQQSATTNETVQAVKP